MIQGAFDFFRKPFNADVLLASIRRALMCGGDSKNELFSA
jgi:FixJ family two-component response regulator